MNNFWIGFLLGLMPGAIIGFATCAIMSISSKCSREEEHQDWIDSQGKGL